MTKIWQWTHPRTNIHLVCFYGDQIQIITQGQRLPCWRMFTKKKKAEGEGWYRTALSLSTHAWHVKHPHAKFNTQLCSLFSNFLSPSENIGSASLVWTFSAEGGWHVVSDCSVQRKVVGGHKASTRLGCLAHPEHYSKNDRLIANAFYRKENTIIAHCQKAGGIVFSLFVFVCLL